MKQEIEELKKRIEELEKKCNSNEKTTEYDYEVVNYNNYEWYVIKKEEKSVLLFMKNRLSQNEMKELFDESLLDDYCDVKFSYTKDNWRWADSPIRFVLNSKWLSKFKLNELVQMKTTVELGNEKSTTRDYVRLLTIEELEELPFEIRKVNDEYEYWTGSPAGFDGDYACEWYIHSNGCLYGRYMDNSYGVRPAVSITLDTYHLITKHDGSCEKEGE